MRASSRSGPLAVPLVGWHGISVKRRSAGRHGVLGCSSPMPAPLERRLVVSAQIGVESMWGMFQLSTTTVMRRNLAVSPAISHSATYVPKL